MIDRRLYTTIVGNLSYSDDGGSPVPNIFYYLLLHPTSPLAIQYIKWVPRHEKFANSDFASLHPAVCWPTNNRRYHRDQSNSEWPDNVWKWIRESSWKDRTTPTCNTWLTYCICISSVFGYTDFRRRRDHEEMEWLLVKPVKKRRSPVSCHNKMLG